MKVKPDENIPFDVTRAVLLTLADVVLVSGSSKTALVEVLRRYSKHSQYSKGVRKVRAFLDKPWCTRTATGAPHSHRLARRLDSKTVRAIAEAYGGGASAAELAERYGLSRNGVLATLRKQGAVIRHPRLTPEDCAEIIELYRSGQSQVDIARRFSREPSNIWHVLERAGLKGNK